MGVAIDARRVELERRPRRINAARRRAGVCKDLLQASLIAWKSA
jgi:hypothetical protein